MFQQTIWHCNIVNCLWANQTAWVPQATKWSTYKILHTQIRGTNWNDIIYVLFNLKNMARKLYLSSAHGSYLLHSYPSPLHAMGLARRWHLCAFSVAVQHWWIDRPPGNSSSNQQSQETASTCIAQDRSAWSLPGQSLICSAFPTKTKMIRVVMAQFR
jgi:hypothetical protein